MKMKDSHAHQTLIAVANHPVLTIYNVNQKSAASM